MNVSNMVCAVKGKVYIKHYAFIINGTYVRAHLIYTILPTRNNENDVQHNIQIVGGADFEHFHFTQYHSPSLALYFLCSFLRFSRFVLFPSAFFSVNPFSSQSAAPSVAYIPFTPLLPIILSAFSFPLVASLLEYPFLF